MVEVVERLRSYLDSSLLMKPGSIEGQFRKAAGFLLRNCIIKIDSGSYRITEVEFYYHSKVHPDPFIHRSPEQLRMGSWYFHKVGQDITFGDGKNYGGILIRGIRDRITGERADGPVKTYHMLFGGKRPGAPERHTIEMEVQGEQLGDATRQVLAFPRVGLQPTKEKPGEYFILAPYRYMFFPEITSRDRNVVYFYLNYIYEPGSIQVQVIADRATIKYYEEMFRQGSLMKEEEYRLILNGGVKMNATNKCRLLGYCFKDRLNV